MLPIWYGVPSGTDGRVIFFNKKLFAQAGLPADWQPTSWDDIITAGQTLKAKLPGVTPIQLNGGVAMGEATYYPTATALISDWHRPAMRGRALSLHQTAVFAGAGMGALAARTDAAAGRTRGHDHPRRLPQLARAGPPR